ncbi:MAG: hypothetical protein MPEBLZ_04022 [Candidatus Methanoperedens nitroreducens]|uniref:Uncharacterized protein n=1 Tax=Candidatus Methanoperedens nitratireducens TaxID=1392998 RepID=A0A0P7ZD72_9EURY|nr:hypothetical protein [Candidatus Methanoperedens sp. BLZ2]KAB2942682.1 MAG: hypothetical protein F9K14_16985 [Candidatus Methanoperedens sp.]KPQ41423.1 MAG: hypothetical protein MPEBLZ_04022 [Candidatus Methanoperedens sp. BLZ1]MBZ0177474.1 hypothetical protein [Candidatus Methanoperedens nitroreducens]MCX9079164.1 hypothetical protein [Candidatus Methanoperedens sp.]
MTVLIESLNKYKIPLKTLDNLPKSTQIKNSENISRKNSKEITSVTFGRTNNDLKHLEIGSRMPIKEGLILLSNSALSRKRIERFSSATSSRQIDVLPRIITRNDIRNKLLAFEKKYNKTSDKFYSDWKQGKAIDNLDTLKWATYYEMWKQKYFM